MGKAADLSEFDRGQIVMARSLGTSITETAQLVGCSRSVVVSIHAKWINDGDTSSRRQGVGHSRVIKENERRRLPRLVTQNWRQTEAQLTAQYNAGPSASVSEHTVQRTLLDMGLCSRRPTRVPLLTKIETGPWMSGRELPGGMNPDFSFITSMVVSGHAVCQANSCSSLVQQVIHRLVVAVLCSGTRSCGRTDHESCKLSEHHCGSVAPFHGVCLPNWKWNLPAGQLPMSQGSDCVGVVRGAY
ncbi:hypothetical protein AVEN_244000-1 [Araneus ventricosus]|uniref:Transposase Tc1-like domain-containing protein n=1 Tax=Araneus ventricosus TaxID=182803 RepID=A0A4Y2I366_ARAVE|nr:hypothetical protein AVEN_244000-1 [Araneus ventricosus]